MSYDGKREAAPVTFADGAAGDTEEVPVPGELLNVQRGLHGSEPSTHEAGALVILITTGMVGDCNGDRVVTVDELVKGVNIALGTLALEECPVYDADGNNAVTVDELIRAVTNALTGGV